MKKTFNILITSAGRRVQLCKLFKRDVEDLGYTARIIIADQYPSYAASSFFSDKTYTVSHASSPEYIKQLLEICRIEEIKLIVPTIDLELLPLAKARSQFLDLGTLINVSDPSVVMCARDKISTARSLSSGGVSVPKTAIPEEVIGNKNWCWPSIFKPRDGSSSIGLKLISSEAELLAAANAIPNGLVQERLDGPEYTVNMFVAETGECVSAVPHFRKEVRGGEVSKAITVRHADLCAVARRVAKALPGAFGVICFQAIVCDGHAQVFEINARFGGGFPLARRAGAPYSRWLIQLALGLTPRYSDDWVDGSWMIRFDDAVFGTVTDQSLRENWLR